MKNLLLLLISLICSTNFAQDSKNSINWISINDLNNQPYTDNKALLIYFYADWCSVCQEMNNSTFKDSKIYETINRKFIPLKFNVEYKDRISFGGEDLNFSKSKGVHEFYSIFFENRGFPAFVIMDFSNNKMSKANGYFNTEKFYKFLNFE